MKKKVSLFLVLVLLCSLFGAQISFAEEPMDIHWIVYGQTTGETPTTSNRTIDYLNERFNINIIVEELNSFTEQWNVFWASGGSADYIQTNKGGDVFKLVEQGVVRSIPDGWLDEYAPDLMAQIYARIPKDVVKASISRDGKDYCIPYTSNFATSFAMVLRSDYVEKLGITELPTTFEGFHELCRQLTFGDPDGNGIDDTYALNGPQTGVEFAYLSCMYGFFPGAYYLGEDDKVTFTGTYDQYKELLHVLNDWYEEGLIDPEFVTDTRDDMHRKFAEGRIGIAVNNHGWLANTLIPMLKEMNPEAELVFLQPWESEDGRQWAHTFLANCAGDGAGFFGIDCPDEVVKKVLQIQNEMVKDLDLYKRLYFGEEGVDYTLDENGQMYQTDEQKSASYVTKHGLKQTFCVRTIDFEAATAMQNENMRFVLKELAKNPAEDRLYAYNNFIAPETNEAYNDLNSEVNTIYKEFYINAITGKVDIDAEWDNYLAQLNQVGLQDILDEYNAMFE
ncbi:MAG: hypothetical protein E7329_04155 [Clostridiales bacterium]|nr:hypothetical protein [Clostridiales bacterium]